MKKLWILYCLNEFFFLIINIRGILKYIVVKFIKFIRKVQNIDVVFKFIKKSESLTNFEAVSDIPFGNIEMIIAFTDFLVFFENFIEVYLISKIVVLIKITFDLIHHRGESVNLKCCIQKKEVLCSDLSTLVICHYFSELGPNIIQFVSL